MSIEQELNAPVRPGSTGLNQEEPGKFPFEAFEFDLPTETAPTLYLKDPWLLDVVGGLIVGSGDTISTVTIGTAEPDTLALNAIYLQREE